MTAVYGAGVAAWQVLACLGLGAVLLRLVGLRDTLPWGERLMWCFGLGFGCLGWLLFLLGIADLFQAMPLALVLLASCAGLACLGKPGHGSIEPLTRVQWMLVTGLAAVACGDVLEALAPPVDADSLAYHFELPRRFLEAGGLFFVPRAVDGGVPLLAQMTYVSALGLGGERAMTLWTGLSGWAAVGLLYVLCRRHLDRSWSLAGALLLASTPTVIYAAGSGQVEIRMALFVLMAAFGTAAALRLRDPRWALMAGIATGFAIGSKYTGLLLVPAAGVICLMGAGWFQRGAVFAAGVAVAGGQWYVWNALNSGDPLFPMFYPWLGYPADGMWDATQDALLRQVFFDPETPLARSVWNYFGYPFRATLFGDPAMESGRTGLGPWGLVILPMALLGAWRFRKRLATHPLAPVMACLLLFYTLWFFTGSSQRVRHLLPVYPLFLIGFLVAAQRWSGAMNLRRPVAATFLAAFAVQLPAQGLYVLPFLWHAASGENREAFLARSVQGYAIVPWINANLSPKQDRVAMFQRQLMYLVDIPTYFVHPIFQALVNARPEARDARRFAEELKALGITHILDVGQRDDVTPPSSGGFPYLIEALQDSGCVSELYRVRAPVHGSRTLPTLYTGTQMQRILKLQLAECPYGR